MIQPVPRKTIISTVDFSGLRRDVSTEDVRALISAGRFFWLDICVGEESSDFEFLEQLGLDDADRAWALRFGQAGRMTVGPHSVRAVTWVTYPLREVIEIHFRSSVGGILTVWTGHSQTLEDVSQKFVERFSGLETKPYYAAGVFLQLLLSTLDQEISNLDDQLGKLRDQLEVRPESIKYTDKSRRLQLLRKVWLKLDRYASAVRSSLIGIEALPGIDAQGVRTFCEYAEQIEDLENRLNERLKWASDLVEDYAAETAQRQSEQISRLTIVSIIFLPISFLTGFFGMNFAWMTEEIGGSATFLRLVFFSPSCA